MIKTQQTKTARELRHLDKTHPKAAGKIPLNAQGWLSSQDQTENEHVCSHHCYVTLYFILEALTVKGERYGKHAPTPYSYVESLTFNVAALG